MQHNRIKEIINASKTISTPVITASLVSHKSEQAARIVKGRIEKTYLRDIAAILAPTYHSENIFLSIQIDMEAIRKLQLEVTLRSIAGAIVAAPKLKIKASDVRMLPKSNKIRVYATSDGPEEDQYVRLMQLARSMPDIVVKVSCCPVISRVGTVLTYFAMVGNLHVYTCHHLGRTAGSQKASHRGQRPSRGHDHRW